jgi:hypothetical protein
MVKKLIVKPILTDEEFGKKYEGTWFEEKDVDQIIKEDADVYGLQDDGTEKLLGKFRKKVIPKETVQLGWDAFRLLAIPSRNRGASAGPIDVKGKYWSKRKPVEINKWATRYKINGKLSKMRVNNVVASGVMGYYESTAFLDAACRMTSHTRSGLKNFFHGMPFLKTIDAQFKKLVPSAHEKQLKAVRKHKMYQIDDTAFSTVTVNLNFRTALHKDAGDFKEGFGNLSVIEWGKYHGGYTVLPRYRIGFDVRSGDFLAMDVHEWHTNTPMYETEEDKEFNKALPNIQTRDPESGVVGSALKFQRLTFVCYFREKIQQCDERKTLDYYKREEFDEKEATKKARLASVAMLPIPGYTGTLEEAIHAVENTVAGSSARLAQTRKEKRIRTTTRKNKKTRD